MRKESGEGPGGLPALGTLLLHAVWGAGVPAWVGSMGTAARLDLVRNHWVLAVPARRRPWAIPLDWPWGVRDGVTEVPGGGQLRDRVSGAREVPYAREVARPLGVKSGTRGGGRHRFGSVLTAVGVKMSPGREVVERGPEAR